MATSPPPSTTPHPDAPHPHNPNPAFCTHHTVFRCRLTPRRSPPCRQGGPRQEGPLLQLPVRRHPRHRDQHDWPHRQDPAHALGALPWGLGGLHLGGWRGGERGHVGLFVSLCVPEQALGACMCRSRPLVRHAGGPFATGCLAFARGQAGARVGLALVVVLAGTPLKEMYPMPSIT